MRSFNVIGHGIRIVVGFACMLCIIQCDEEKSGKSGGRNYFLHPDGNDEGAGTHDDPWKSIAKANATDFEPGDTLFLEGGRTFQGTLRLDSGDAGNTEHAVVVTSHGNGKATIHSGNASALVITNTSYVHAFNLHLTGSGRKEGNIESGLSVENSSAHILVDNLDIEAFQKAGLRVYSSSFVTVSRVHAHDNGAAGISVSGYSQKSDATNITIRDCFAENNPGDPTNKTNHSGNGIIVGMCRNVLIEYCAATNNGWDMPRIGNGPVGIWAWEADSVIIQHCVAYKNKTSPGGEDGGGFDLDGGVTNSIIQYCLSYENQGSGIGLFQYNGASEWKSNTIRFNISENDGLVSMAHAGIYIWNGSSKANEFSDCFIYNNVIVNAEGSAIRFATQSNRQRFFYYNNIFTAKKDLTAGIFMNDKFLANNWWSVEGGFNIDGVTSLSAWANATGQEKFESTIKGSNVDPKFTNEGPTTLTDPRKLSTYFNYKLPAGSPLHSSGIDLHAMFGISTGSKDFSQQNAPATGVGASF